MIFMKIEINPKKTAFLAMDMQNDLIKEGGALPDIPGVEILEIIKENKLIENVGKAIKTARKMDIPIFHIKTLHRKDQADVFESTTDMSLEGMEFPPMLIEETWGSEFIDEIEPEEKDYIIEKRGSNSFYATDLDLTLRALEVDTLIVTGVITDGCVDATVQGARDRGFDVIVLTDCTATITRKNQNFWLENVFPRATVTVSTDEFIDHFGKN